MKAKVHFIHVERDITSHSIGTAEFDRLVDEGYDDIVVVTPRARFVASIDDWLNYSYIYIIGDDEVRVLQKAYMGRV